MAYTGGGTTELKTNGFSTGGEEDSLDSLGSRERKGGQACALLDSGKRYLFSAVHCSGLTQGYWQGLGKFKKPTEFYLNIFPLQLSYTRLLPEFKKLYLNTFAISFLPKARLQWSCIRILLTRALEAGRLTELYPTSFPLQWSCIRVLTGAWEVQKAHYIVSEYFSHFHQKTKSVYYRQNAIQHRDCYLKIDLQM